MRVCPACERMYPEGENERCPYDQSPLYAVGEGGAATEDPYKPGTTIAGKHVIGEEIHAHSGAGRTFLATQSNLQRQVELRILPQGAFTRPSDAARFQREVATWGRIRSDHVVRLYDSGFTELGAPYMVLERVGGGSLGSRLQASGPLGFAQCRLVAEHALLGLQAAHAANVLHRDLSPFALVMGQRSDGTRYTRLTGFGFAKHIGEGEDDPTAITMTGQVIGDPAYMAPETILEGLLEPRTDLYALGVTLFELLAGRRPFPGRTLAELLGAHVQGRPEPLTRYRKDAPPAAVDFIGRLLARDPADRYASAAEALCALRASPPWADAEPIDGARPATGSVWAPVALALVVGIAFAITITLLYLR